MMKTTENQKQAAVALTKNFGERAILNNSQILDFTRDAGFKRSDVNWLFAKEYKVSRGRYQLPAVEGNVEIIEKGGPKVQQKEEVVVAMSSGSKFNPNAVNEFDHVKIPEKDMTFVPFGEAKSISKIVKSGKFFPVFFSGWSGNGKTFSIEQACARAGRAMVRVQMSRETDEDDLIGGFRLIQGETKFMKGPVLRAMETGAILLIDEADRADAGKVMCLQGVLEGKPYYVKKTGEVINPAPGFNIFVTANTKGKGSDDGRYAAAGILDDAWLERFPITLEQTFPNPKTEFSILKNVYAADGSELNEEIEGFLEKLINWANITRKTCKDGAVDELISTRRLVHIVRAYKMFDDRLTAIKLCCNRFDAEVRDDFVNLYSKLDDAVDPSKNEAQTDGENPF